MWLIMKKYHHTDSDHLVHVLKNLIGKLKEICSLEYSYKFPIFIDKAQLFCPNEHNLLHNKYTCTPHNIARQNDLFSLLLNTFSTIKENRLFITGIAFTGEVIEFKISSAGKQNEGIKVIVGQSLIETKEDLLGKLQSIMKTKELSEFVDASIQNYLPIRRRVFTLACSKILEKNINNAESFKAAFDESIEETKKAITKHFKDFSGNYLNDKTILKFYSLFDFSVFDHTYLGATLPPTLKKFKRIFITSGIAPYITYPQVNSIGQASKYLENLFVKKLHRIFVVVWNLLMNFRYYSRMKRKKLP